MECPQATENETRRFTEEQQQQQTTHSPMSLTSQPSHYIDDTYLLEKKSIVSMVNKMAIVIIAK